MSSILEYSVDYGAAATAVQKKACRAAAAYAAFDAATTAAAAASAVLLLSCCFCHIGVPLLRVPKKIRSMMLCFAMPTVLLFQYEICIFVI